MLISNVTRMMIILACLAIAYATKIDSSLRLLIASTRGRHRRRPPYFEEIDALASAAITSLAFPESIKSMISRYWYIRYLSQESEHALVLFVASDVKRADYVTYLSRVAERVSEAQPFFSDVSEFQVTSIALAKFKALTRKIDGRRAPEWKEKCIALSQSAERLSNNVSFSGISQLRTHFATLSESKVKEVSCQLLALLRRTLLVQIEMGTYMKKVKLNDAETLDAQLAIDYLMTITSFTLSALDVGMHSGQFVFYPDWFKVQEGIGQILSLNADLRKLVRFTECRETYGKLLALQRSVAVKILA